MALPQGAKTRKKTAQNQFEQRWLYLENLLLERRPMVTKLSGIICNNFTARKVDYACHMLLSEVVTWSFICILVPELVAFSRLFVSPSLTRKARGRKRKETMTSFKCI